MVGCALTKEKRERPKLSGDSKIKENVFKNLFVTKQEDLKALTDGITSAVSSSTAMTTAQRHPPQNLTSTTTTNFVHDAVKNKKGEYGTDGHQTLVSIISNAALEILTGLA